MEGVVMMCRDPRKRPGLARVEVLVVLLVLVALAGILVPGCARQRGDASRRMECSNNLRNIGFAMQNYESGKGHFPSENPKDNPDYPTGGSCPSFYAQLCDDLELANSCLQGGDPQKPIAGAQAKVFLCPSRRMPRQSPGGRDYGYLKSDSQITAILDTQKVSVKGLAEKRGTAATALLAHVWVFPTSYVQDPANPSWAAPYPAHAMTNSSRIYADTDPAGTNALGSPHTNMPAVFADNHIGCFPLSYPQPQLAAVFSIKLSSELRNVP